MNPNCLVVVLIGAISLTGFAQPTPQAGPQPFPAPPSPPGIGSPATNRLIPFRPGPVMPGQLPNTILAWDSESKETNAKTGDAEAHFTFFFTNISSSNVLITSATASCGCTVAKLPPLPWTNAPGAFGEIPVTMNLAGKSGVVPKTITVNTDHGTKTLNVRVIIAPPPVVPTPPMDRNKNQELSKVDRQAVFKGDCVRCHVVPTRGKSGAELYQAACGICHEAEHRATMVPNLHALNHDTNADFWKTWISQGKPGSLMPAFAVSQGGPLNEGQINTLVQYLVTTIPAQAAKPAAAK